MRVERGRRPLERASPFAQSARRSVARVGAAAVLGPLAMMAVVGVVVLPAHHISVVTLPLLWVREHAIALADLRESLSRIRVPRVDIWVRLLGKHVKLSLQLRLCGMHGHSEHFIVVLWVIGREERRAV